MRTLGGLSQTTGRSPSSTLSLCKAVGTGRVLLLSCWIEKAVRSYAANPLPTSNRREPRDLRGLPLPSSCHLRLLSFLPSSHRLELRRVLQRSALRLLPLAPRLCLPR